MTPWEDYWVTAYTAPQMLHIHMIIYNIIQSDSSNSERWAGALATTKKPKV